MCAIGAPREGGALQTAGAKEEPALLPTSESPSDGLPCSLMGNMAPGQLGWNLDPEFRGRGLLFPAHRGKECPHYLDPTVGVLQPPQLLVLEDSDCHTDGQGAEGSRRPRWLHTNCALAVAGSHCCPTHRLLEYSLASPSLLRSPLLCSLCAGRLGQVAQGRGLLAPHPPWASAPVALSPRAEGKPSRRLGDPQAAPERAPAHLLQTFHKRPLPAGAVPSASQLSETPMCGA